MSGLDISVRSEAFQTEDRSWLGSAHGTDSTQTITLATNLFDAEDHYPNGYIPSGVWLGLVTSGEDEGCYGPYDNGASDGRQTCVGVLFNSISVPTNGVTRVGAPMQIHGVIVEANLPDNHGLDANGKTELGSRFVFRAA